MKVATGRLAEAVPLFGSLIISASIRRARYSGIIEFSVIGGAIKDCLRMRECVHCGSGVRMARHHETLGARGLREDSEFSS